ncbi:MAG: bifunctional lysine ketoglutarate reductase /saccharopine dehydrogenase family protein [Planctomycetota bacterium]
MTRIGIRREDKSRWERRTPLVPEDVKRLVENEGLEFVVQTSPIRVFPDDTYRAGGAAVADHLTGCPLILGIKEIPPALLEAGKTYVYFSHTIKGQAQNMPALRRLMELGCQLIDYERILDAQGRRLVLFGPYAGQAGMIDTLWALGQRLRHEGLETPFARVQPAHRYADLAHAKREITQVGESIRQDGLPPSLRPLICGLSGYGAVSKGAQAIYDCLPVEEVVPEELASLPAADHVCYKVVFKEEHMVERVDRSAPFQLQEYYDHPERYRPRFFPNVEYLTLLMNCIFWTPKYPRLVTREQLRRLYSKKTRPRLRVIGDVSCDLEGAIECNVRTTTPDAPVYVYEPATGQTRDGVAGDGPVILAIDFLPCELPLDSSYFFSRVLSPWVPALARADFSGLLADSGLPPELQRATILYRGELTEPYRYLSQMI